MKHSNAKNVFMILLAILLVGGSFVLAEYRNKNQEIIYTNESLIIENKDKNNSDSTDWKKILLANEINATSSIKDITQKEEALTQTDKLARDFFARYMELRQMGISGDKASQEELVNQILKNGVVLSSPKVYSITDILVKNDDSTESIKQYGNEVGNIFKNNTVNSRNELMIVKDSMEKENPEILKELDPIIKNQKNVLNLLLKVKVPQELYTYHLKLINSISSSIFVTENFRKSNADALAGIQAVQIYLETVKSLFNSIENLKNYFATKSIFFTKYEGGSIFIKDTI